MLRFFGKEDIIFWTAQQELPDVKDVGIRRGAEVPWGGRRDSRDFKLREVQKLLTAAGPLVVHSQLQ
ncbi:MAG: hypothetical protein R3C01_09165 [Planctomycetaceae bacterium]